MAITCRTLPENGAATWVSIFIASSTARRSPVDNRVAWLHRNGNHYRWRRRVHHAAVVPIDAVRDAVHFDPVTQTLIDRDDVETLSKGGEPIFKWT